ncbi:O-acetyl-ADP-ribose deacetylase [Actinopolymorpha sp. B17G11]|uniref:O-acetyl-ADP-ribose deacetylase n=1 Tax=Actinopolymorpha sp. B17G11 TaxID=3160861 RepID=UPI0032E392F9
MRVELLDGDITEQPVDVIVNAANPSLLGGAGVDGAIHRRGGPAIIAECQALRTSQYPRGLPIGEAVATTAGELPARWVVHTAGPVWSASTDRSDLLRACYRSALLVADGLHAATVAFPLISAGLYGWPVEDAARQALSVLVPAEPDDLVAARLILFGRRAYETALAVHEELDA